MNFSNHDSLIYDYLASIVARIALVKPEKARGVEDVLLRAAQMGQIVEKVRWKAVVHESTLKHAFGYIGLNEATFWFARYLKKDSFHCWSRLTIKHLNKPKLL